MTDDLLSRLTAAVDEAERVAKAATPGPWAHYFMSGDTAHWGVDTAVISSPPRIAPPVMHKNNAAHIAACDPEDRLRHVEHARRVMARHRRHTYIAWTATFPPYSGTLTICLGHNGGYVEFAKCPDLLDLAAAWGVTE